MPFTRSDFTEHATRLTVIIMEKMNRNPLDHFHDLEEGQKNKFNRLLNTYISQLPEDFSTTILSDFNRVCTEDVFTRRFNPSLCTLPSQSRILVTDEQREKIASGEFFFTDVHREMMF